MAASARTRATISRRELLSVGFLAGCAAFAGTIRPVPAEAGSAEPAMSRRNAHSFSFETIDGGRLDLARFRGRPILVVNTASRCGFTAQYEGLQYLHGRYRDAGLVVIGVPSNDFRQELASNEEVAAFCEARFGIDFPLTAISRVTGAQAHPFYRWAREVRPGETPRWNFHKYLIAPDGDIAAVFATTTAPEHPHVITAIEALLRG
ncbi:MAG: glutathione peroxidase [Salinarimonas sp.]